MSDAEVFAGRTFYRAVAAGGISGQYAYIGVQNPADSGINLLIDEIGIWAGLPGESAEVGILNYATPFSQWPVAPGFTYTGTVQFISKLYGAGCANSKSLIYLGAYNDLLNPQVDYFFQSACNNQSMIPESFDDPIEISPGAGIAFWLTTKDYELKVALKVREMPQSYQG